MNLIKAWGSGIPKILQSCKEYSLKEPLLRDLGVSFKFTIYRLMKTEEVSGTSGMESGMPESNSGIVSSQSGIPETNSGIENNEFGIPVNNMSTIEKEYEPTEKEKELLNVLYIEKEMSASGLAKELGSSDRRVRAILLKLFDKNMVTRINSTKFATYRLFKEEKYDK